MMDGSDALGVFLTNRANKQTLNSKITKLMFLLWDTSCFLLLIAEKDKWRDVEGANTVTSVSVIYS